jgi:hypothetical protein
MLGKERRPPIIGIQLRWPPVVEAGSPRWQLPTPANHHRQPCHEQAIPDCDRNDHSSAHLFFGQESSTHARVLTCQGANPFAISESLTGRPGIVHAIEPLLSDRELPLSSN